jgi:hypothetical protein
MATRGRPTKQPATVYQYRRAVLLVQALAIQDAIMREAALHRLGMDWGIVHPAVRELVGWNEAQSRASRQPKPRGRWRRVKHTHRYSPHVHPIDWHAPARGQ